MFEINSLSRHFGKKIAIDNVSFSIPAGQMVGIIGRSGAGKSTMLRMINRLAEPTSGSIHFNGVEVSKLSGAALRGWQRDCAMIFQQFNLVPRLDVLTNVLLGRLNHRSTVLSILNMFTREERIMAIAALERLGIEQAALQPAGTLSGGQQQRVAIARALMQQPNYCERIIGMANGRVVFDGTPAELTGEAVRTIYGTDGDIEESMTSTSITYRPVEAAQAIHSAPAFAGA
jgi:phosphonate transport system ATP-binding protein